jgi:outer membrane protein OmpA-like peptidoglycan-associated protein
MDALAKANALQRQRIEGLNKKIDSLHTNIDEMEKEAATVVVRDGFVANDLQFETSSAKLTGASLTELNRIAYYLQVNEGVYLTISGHTDNTGNAAANLLLSQKRGQAVYDYLVARGVQGNRMEHQGYGDRQPIGDNNTEIGRNQNRRVELRIK